MEITNDDAKRNQEFLILNVLASHCGEFLNSEKVEAINEEFKREIRAGSCAWSFVPAAGLLGQIRRAIEGMSYDSTDWDDPCELKVVDLQDILEFLDKLEKGEINEQG